MQREREGPESDSEWPGWEDRDGGLAGTQMLSCGRGREKGFNNVGGFAFWLYHGVCTIVW